MNSIAISFDALMRSGVRSLASILVDTSIARTMSIPSVSTFESSSEDLGRASATTIITRAKVLRMKGMWRSMFIYDMPPFLQGVATDTLRCGWRPALSRYM